MNLWHSVTGRVSLKIVTADSVGLMNLFNDNGIILYNASRLDELTINVDLSGKEYLQVKKILKRRGDSYEVLLETGIPYIVKKMLRRPVLLLGILIISFLVFYTPSRVLFVEVKGNTTVQSNLILEKASQCGIRFGSSRKHVRSEKVKNMLIAQIPELQWVGVNTDGCVATIHVTERTAEQADENYITGVSSIVASRDGVVLSCTVLRGTALCKTGQAVKQGETLVSGYTDCGICVQATSAKAEVLAQTTRPVTVITPERIIRRDQLVSSNTNYYIRIGKKLINFCKGSGIPDATCVKMYEEKHLVLHGGFILPVSLIKEQRLSYELNTTDVAAFDWLTDFAVKYMETQMVAGQIIHQDVHLQSGDGVVYLSGKYDCTEMIGQTKQEEIIENDGYD